MPIDLGHVERRAAASLRRLPAGAFALDRSLEGCGAGTELRLSITPSREDAAPIGITAQERSAYVVVEVGVHTLVEVKGRRAPRYPDEMTAIIRAVVNGRVTEDLCFDAQGRVTRSDALIHLDDHVLHASHVCSRGRNSPAQTVHRSYAAYARS